MTLRILVVDDDAANLELVDGRLEAAGYTTVLAETGGEGLRLALADHFDAVLLDLRLPDTDGLEVLEAVRRERPELPILIMTAHGSEAIAVKALTAGAAGYLIKPISRRELIDAVVAAVGAAASRQSAQTTFPPSVVERRLAALLAAMSEGAAIVSGNGRLEALNAAALALLKQHAAPDTVAALGAQVAEVRDEAGNPFVWPAFDGEALPPSELDVRWRDGTEQSLDVSARPIEGPDGREGWIVTFRDVTARRARRAKLESLLEQQAAALSEAQARLRSETDVAAASIDRMKRSLLSTVSHELRTPLNFIVGFGSVLADGVLGDLTAEQATLLGKMLFGAERLTEMVEELLDAAMLAAGMLAPAPLPVDIGPIAEAAVAQARDRAAGAGVSLESLPGAAPLAYADAEYVAKVVRQLLDNALKFTGRGGRVTVTVEPAPATGEPSVVVADTGPGIAPQDIPRLYERFVQLDGTATRRYGGFGLGLATAKGLATSMGGRIELESTLGLGSRFRLIVPAAGDRG